MFKDDDRTPTENEIATVAVGDVRLTVEALERAHAGGKLAGFAECRDNCDTIAKASRRTMWRGWLLGCATVAVIATVGALLYLWIVRW